MIIAHRGYLKIEPENTLAAFDVAWSAGADGVECDLRLVAGRVVVSHDFVRNVTLTLDQLFDYIAKTDKQFFLEVKNNSRVLAEAIIDKIKIHNLWGQIQIIGFWQNIRAALVLQGQYPLLRVSQILMFPWLAYLKMPPRSYGVYFGWLDHVPGSRWLFKLLINAERLKKLKTRFETAGFKVMVGVINQTSDLDLFVQAGIDDIFTDNVPEVAEYLRNMI